MTDVSDEERCIALTNSGDRCSRIAKNGRFCFQHDQSSETVGGADSNPNGFLSIVSGELQIRPEQLSGVRRDVAQNIEQIIAQTGDLTDSITKLDFPSSLNQFKNTVGSTGPTAGKGALIGGVVGSPFGPVGVAAGATAGGWYGVYKSVRDDRALAASVVDEPPADAEVSPSNHRAIEDVDPIQLTIRSALETDDGRTEWLRNTLTRERDMDEVATALEDLPEYDSDAEESGYYIRDHETSETLVLVFGVPEDDEK